jgi:hypothetical protein
MRRALWGIVAAALLAAPAAAGVQDLGIAVPPPPGPYLFTLLAADGLGNVYACDGNAVWRLDWNTSAFTSLYTGLASAAGASVDPSGFAVTPDGAKAYVATGWTGRIVEVDLAGGTARELSGARLTSNYGLAADPIYGKVFVTDSFTQALHRLDPAGNGSLALLDDFDNSGWFGSGIAFSPDGQLVVPVGTAFSAWPDDDNYPADLYLFSRAWLDAAAAGGTPAGPGSPYAGGVQVSGTGAVAVDSQGNAYLLATDAIYRVDPSGVRSIVAGDSSQNAFDMIDYGFMGLAYDASADRLLFAYRDSPAGDWTLHQYAVPEPASLALVAAGAAVLLAQRRPKRP